MPRPFCEAMRMHQEDRGPTAPGGCLSPCPLADACELPGAITRIALLLWRRQFCDDERRFESCQRFLAARRGEPVPSRMLPNGQLAGA